MRTIGVVTVGRSDYYIYQPILEQIQAEPELNLRLFVSGAHLSPAFGLTAQEIEKDGYSITARVETLPSSDTPEAVSKSMGRGTIGFAEVYARERPDILLVLGDRFEMHAAVVAAVPFRIPVAHIHGGEITEGAIDDVLRHSMTKLSHFHFVSTETYRQRLIQMGEEPWRVVTSGAPALDNIRCTDLIDWTDLSGQLDLAPSPRPLLVTYHPVTMEHEHTVAHIEELLIALESSELPIVFTMPNADTGGQVIASTIREFASQNMQVRIFDNLGARRYYSLMASVTAMVGNSSSGIIEAPSFELPVVNVGNRQRGRIRAENVIDVGNSRDEIRQGISRARSSEFRNSLGGMSNPYGSGNAAGRIVGQLKSIPLEQSLLVKCFNDLAPSGSAQLPSPEKVS